MRRLLIIGLLLAASTAFAQNVYSVGAQAGASLYDKVTNAQALCSSPCILIFENYLAQVPNESSQGSTWAAKIGTTATTVTALAYAHFYGSIENGTTAGTLNIQYANIGTTGTTVVKRGSWCKLQ